MSLIVSRTGVKGDVLKVLQERRLCEEECLKIEKNIGEKLAALTAEVHRSTKECMDNKSPALVLFSYGYHFNMQYYDVVHRRFLSTFYRYCKLRNNLTVVPKK